MRSISTYLLVVITSSLLSSASLHHFGIKEVAEINVDHQSLSLVRETGEVVFENELFTGTGLRFYETGQLAEEIHYKYGKRHGILKRWHPDGTLSYEAFYAANKLHGPVRSWWQNGNLRAEASYEQGKIHGTARQWYESGALFKEMNLEQGLEAGMQRAWRENGKLYVNYEAKDGRIFGLKRANLCFELEEEKVQIDG